MLEEKVPTGGNNTTTIFRAQKPFHVAPKIVGTFYRGGVRYYKDSDGAVHHADTYDKMFGKRDPGAILPKGKSKFQRTYKP